MAVARTSSRASSDSGTSNGHSKSYDHPRPTCRRGGTTRNSMSSSSQSTRASGSPHWAICPMETGSTLVGKSPDGCRAPKGAQRLPRYRRAAGPPVSEPKHRLPPPMATPELLASAAAEAEHWLWPARPNRMSRPLTQLEANSSRRLQDRIHRQHQRSGATLH